MFAGQKSQKHRLLADRTGLRRPEQLHRIRVAEHRIGHRRSSWNTILDATDTGGDAGILLAGGRRPNAAATGSCAGDGPGQPRNLVALLH